jgi:hypothetical protein
MATIFFKVFAVTGTTRGIIGISSRAPTLGICRLRPGEFRLLWNCSRVGGACIIMAVIEDISKNLRMMTYPQGHSH